MVTFGDTAIPSSPTRLGSAGAQRALANGAGESDGAAAPQPVAVSSSSTSAERRLLVLAQSIDVHAHGQSTVLRLSHVGKPEGVADLVRYERFHHEPVRAARARRGPRRIRVEAHVRLDDLGPVPPDARVAGEAAERRETHDVVPVTRTAR